MHIRSFTLPAPNWKMMSSLSITIDCLTTKRKLIQNILRYSSVAMEDTICVSIYHKRLSCFMVPFVYRSGMLIMWTSPTQIRSFIMILNSGMDRSLTIPLSVYANPSTALNAQIHRSGMNRNNPQKNEPKQSCEDMFTNKLYPPFFAR